MGNHRKFIFVCNGSDCKSEGCKDLCNEVKELIHSGHNKGKFKIIKTKCMDFCKSAPVVIYHDEVIKKADISHIKKKIEH